MEETLKERTEALCPECLLPLPATISADGDGVVWMERTCPDHGLVRTRIWPDADHYRWLTSLALPKTPPKPRPPARRAAAPAPATSGAARCWRSR